MTGWLVFIWLCLVATPVQAADFVLTSPDLVRGGTMAPMHAYDRFNCGGDNVSPALVWHNPPAGTHAFAVVMHDPDAPRPGGWWHWLIFDIPRSARALARGAGGPYLLNAPSGSVQSQNSYGRIGYGGPCPPDGDAPHRYIFTVYALDTARLSLQRTARPADVMATLRLHVLGAASLIARYGR